MEESGGLLTSFGRRAFGRRRRTDETCKRIGCWWRCRTSPCTACTPSLQRPSPPSLLHHLAPSPFLTTLSPSCPLDAPTHAGALGFDICIPTIGLRILDATADRAQSAPKKEKKKIQRLLMIKGSMYGRDFTSSRKKMKIKW